MAVPKFTVTGNAYEIGLGVTEDELADAVAVFSPNVKPDAFVTYDGDLVKFKPEYVVTLDEDGSFSIDLPADDDGWNFTGLQWRVEFRIPTPGRAAWKKMRKWWIDAGAPSATVNLASVASAAAVPANPVAGLSESGLVDLLGDEDSTIRAALDGLYEGGSGSGGGDVDGGTPSSSSAGTIDGGTP